LLQEFMNMHTPSARWPLSLSLRIALGLASASAAIWHLPAKAADDAWSAGISANGNATAAEVGLPVYPGAQLLPHQKDGDSGSLQFNLWGGSFGMKLVVAQYRTPDGMDLVAQFYQPAMAKYGPVLECTGRSSTPSSPPPSDKPGVASGSNQALTCDDDRPEAGGRLFKAGTRRQQRLLKLEPMKEARGGTLISLVRLELKGD
jgi:hypothetical protein